MIRYLSTTLLLLSFWTQGFAIEQLFVLNKRWLVLAVDNTPAVQRELERLSNGTYGHYRKRWNLGQTTGWNDWPARDGLIATRKRYMVDAREAAGERSWDSIDAYQLSSPDDPSYSEVLRPLRVTRFIASVGGSEDPNWQEVDYLHYLYLELPKSMQNGHNYFVQLSTGQEIRFQYSDAVTVSRAIKVNQLGYLPDSGQKYAYLGAYLQEFGALDFEDAERFELRRVEDQQLVYTGNVQLRAETPELTGERTYQLDFSAITTPGNYYVRVPNVGRSWPFRIAADVYGEAFYVSARALFHQRAGSPVAPEYSAWSRPAYHDGPVYESAYVPIVPPIPKPKGWQPFDIIGASTDLSRVTEDARGGWYDAADFDRRFTHYLPVLDLLYAYEFAPEKFSDGQLQLPESGNGIPDILDEAEQGLLVWKKSMNNAGGVAGRVETWTHARRNGDEHYAYSLRTRWTSLMYAACAAQFSELVKAFDEEKSKEYLASALKAYAFGTDPNNSLGSVSIPAASKRGKGAPYRMDFVEKESYHKPYLAAAKLRLALATGDDSYLDGLEKVLVDCQGPFEWPFHERLYSVWLYFGLFDERLSSKLEQTVVNRWGRVYLQFADQWLKHIDKMPYRHSWPPERKTWMAWGSTHMSNLSRVFLMAEKLTGKSKYRKAAILNADFMLGGNPMGMSWITGLGQVYPTEIQHEISNEDKIADPVPGIGLYGITEGYGTQRLRDSMWDELRPDGSKVSFLKPANREIPVWRRWTAHPFLNTWQNEFTVSETISANIFVFALLSPNGWAPPSWLRERQPRPLAALFGRHYLP